ncbi:rho guanine nucleotide exchange factor 17 [Agrilus planipennis]|uniref:Rho guanine nucleotide exchange factor 17 n=1 Tax=Agrilus planipennis TaxID=224129 RepID=A0A1W4W968_AGRPL|nr:rho guanine nucleotide exchange factor 17 [Agrilus planipennis]
MNSYGNTRWSEDCFSQCGDCSPCLHFDNNNDSTQNNYSKRFMTVGSVRYGVRLGAVSPPPPGAGPRYRSQCCWPSSPGPLSRSSFFGGASPINSTDIFSYVNRLRITEDDSTSELAEQTTSRHRVLLQSSFASSSTTCNNSSSTVISNFSSRPSVKNQLRRRVLQRPQVYYTRLCDCQDGELTTPVTPLDTLDRLPRFRFGGNRSVSNSKEREKRSSERLKELTDRLKNCRGPVPQRHASSPPVQPNQPTNQDNEKSSVDDREKFRTTPLRSASFSQVDYSSDDKKYVRRRQPSEALHLLSEDSLSQAALTLPRLRNPKKDETKCQALPPSEDVEVTDLCKRIYKQCHEDKIIESLEEVSKELDNDLNDCFVRNSDSAIRKSNQKNIEEEKWNKSKRRKGMYISQWPNNYEANESPAVSPSASENDSTCKKEKSNVETGANFNIYSNEIPKLEISNSEKSENCDVWNDPNQEEPHSPEDNSLNIEWPFIKSHNSEEKDGILLKVKKDNIQRADSLSEGENDSAERKSDQFQISLASDLSDCEGRSGSSTGNHDTYSPRIARRYYKRPLRGPYGQMLEAEMSKNEAGRKQISNDLKFLEDLHATVDFLTAASLSPSSSVCSSDTKSKYSAQMRGSSSHSIGDSQLKNSLNTSGSSNKQSNQAVKRKVSADCSSSNDNEQKLVVNHQRTTSSPSKLEGIVPPEPSNELLEQLLRGSSEQLAANDVNLQRNKDTRTHVVVELYDTERSYVESLQILVTKYLEPLKNPENAILLDASLVDEIFYQIPTILSHHQKFLEELKGRLEQWDLKQKVGDIFLEIFSRTSVIESYTNYVNNWKRARDIIKNAQQTKPAFARFLETTAREHKGKLALDSLLIKPIQKFPKYELLLQRLIKHTDPSHPDYPLLLSAQKEVHELLLKINCTEREALELEQLREIEGLIEGLIELVATDRQYLRHDLVTMTAGNGARKERALFLFSDLLLVTSIKRRSGTIRKPSAGQGSVTGVLEANKYKLLMRISLDDLEIVKAKDENLRQMMIEIENLTDDITVLNQINELAWSLHCTHTVLDEVVKEMLEKLNKQLSDQQNSDSQLSCLDLAVNTSNGLENVSVVFSKPEKRTSWEETFNEAKHKLAISGDRRPVPELVATVPIRKTRAGLQFTCAAPTLTDNRRDVWVCNSDGYVGQVCVLSLQPEPTVTSCNGVCNARIVCIASVPGISSRSSLGSKINHTKESKEEHNTIQFDSSSSSDEDDRSDFEENAETSAVSGGNYKAIETTSIDSDDLESQQSTMWLGTEDGSIHVYNSSDNIRIKKNKIRLQLGSSVLCIIYLDNRVYVSLANGDINIYERELNGTWNVSNPISVAVGSTAMPVTKILPNMGKLWCSCGNSVKIFNTSSLTVETSFTVNNESNKPINCIILSGNGLWLSLQNSAVIKCFHAYSFEFLCEVNVAPAVTKMLTSCDDIIRQHKAACLRVTSLLACKDLLWIGTSAGVLLTMPLPHIASLTTKMNITPNIAGVPYGHTGHVRFISHVEYNGINTESTYHHRYSFKGKQEQRNSAKVLVISGGDGYEDFRSSNLSEVAGREDSTNHLLLWHI